MRPLDAMIAGAQKAGTSSLLSYLAQHPSIVTHRARELTLFVNEAEHARGYDAIAAEQFPEPRDDQKLLAKSAGIMDLPEAIDRLHEHRPGVRLIFALRDPVDRAYSAYWFARRRGWEPVTEFERALDAPADRFGDDWVRRRNTAYIRRGLYADHLARVLERFDRSRVLVLIADGPKRDYAAMCRRVFEFLGVDAAFEPDVTRRVNPAGAARSEAMAQALSGDHGLKRAVRAALPRSLARGIRQRLRRWNERAFEPPPMNEQTRRMLASVFAPHNVRLAERFDLDVSHWSAP